jgi:hypothetical protein
MSYSVCTVFRAALREARRIWLTWRTQTAEKCGERRYTHSLRLPEIIRSIGDRRCFHTGHDNFFTVELIGAQGERVEYTVYFKLSRAPSRGRLNLYVQSAYVQDDIPQRRPKPRKPIRFSAIAYNVAIGKAIKVPK